MPMPWGLPPPDPGFELFVASHGISQGLSQTEGPQVRPRAYIRMGSVQLGGQWRNISSPIASGIAMFFVRIDRKRGHAELEGTVLYRLRTGAKGAVARHAWEFDGSLRESFGKLDLRMIAEYSPKEFEAGQSLYIEAGPSFEVAKGTTVSANLGRRERSGAPDYSTFNLGMTHIIRQKVSLDARVYGTDRSELGTRYKTRLILSVRLML